MIHFIVRRLLSLIPILLGVSLFTFAIVQVTPGDPVVLMLGLQATPERVAAGREQLGLNDPLPIQYGRYLSNVLRGDLGRSIRGQTAVTDEILLRLPSTLQLATLGLLLALSGGLLAGMTAALTPHKWVDNLLMATSVTGLSIPVYFLALITLLVFGVRLGWVQITGGEGIKDLILPAVCLSLIPGATLARVTRASVLEVLQEDYVRTARAKGLSERIVRWRHVLRNALIPIVTVIGLLTADLLTGAVFIEVIFARPGLGRFAINAVANRDFPQVQGIVLFTSVIFVLINLLVDILYGYIDPRIHYE